MHKDITIGSTPAYHSYPHDGKIHPGLIVIHEIWGLVPHIKNVADRCAAAGYSVLAPDLFHGESFQGKADQSLLIEMQDPETRDEAQKKMRELLAPMQAPEFGMKMLAQLKHCVDYLAADAHVSGKIGVLGFCFGGTYSLALAAEDSRILAAVPFYGQPLAAEKIKNLQASVLAFFGEKDTRLMESLPAQKEAMQKDGKDFTAVVYPNTGHAFFNDTNTKMYDAAAAKDAWEKTLAFLSKNLGQ